MNLHPAHRNLRTEDVSMDSHSVASWESRLPSDRGLSRSPSLQVISRRRLMSAASSLAAFGPMLGYAADASAIAPDQKWRVGVIGHTGRGDFGHGLSTVWLEFPDTEIVGVADTNPMGREREQKRTRAKDAFANYRDMIERLRPEIVAVCPRYVNEHHDMIMAAIEGGAQGIYCEKPFCRTLEEADAIVAACARVGTKLALAHRNRYHPVLREISAAIEAGAIGQPLEIRCRGKEDRRGGGQDLWVLGTHLLNLVPVLAGNVTACSATMLVDGHPVSPADIVDGAEGIGPIAGDRLHARYETESGIPVYFDSIRDHGISAAGFGLQVIGNDGVIDLRLDAEPLAHFIPGSPFQPSAKARPWVAISSGGIGQPEPIDKIGYQVAHHILAVRDLMSAIRENRQPLCSDVDGRATLEMVLATFASHAQGGKLVALPLASRTHPFADWRSDE